MQLHLSLLGPPQIELNGKPLRLPSRKAQALLFYLAVTGRAHPRERLAGLLWGGLPQEKAQRNLRVALSKLRRDLDAYLLADRQSLAFNFDCPHRLDVAQFQAACQEQQRRAAALYRGDFLEGFQVRNAPEFEEWVWLTRERLQQDLLQTLRALAAEAAEHADYATAIGDLRRILHIDPWREEAHRELMRLLALNGQRGQALAQFEQCRRILEEEFNVEPGPRTLALHKQIQSGTVPGSGVLPGPEAPAPPHNLPAPTTSFVGREKALEQIAQLLVDPACRLLTLFGPGGVGKTRLALQAARAALPHFAGGVFLVRLDAVSGPVQLLTAVADALGLPASGRRDRQQQLLDYLRARQLLLVLDNFEHLREEATRLVDILQQAPQVKLLVTSRATLNLYEEVLFEVPGLALPPPEETDPETLSQYSAVALFLQRARQTSLSFTLDDHAAHVARICRLLHGLPLGIELAAAWVRALPCADIAARIADNLHALETRLHNVPQRQRSLRAVFDHSWQLLTPAERRHLRRLAVFRGGFTARAAAAITGAGRRALAALRDKALLRLETHRREAHSRYELHPLVLQFARERLAAAPQEQAATRAAHSRFYATQLQDMEKEWRGPRQAELLDAIQQEIDNCRAGWQWALGQPDLLSGYVQPLLTYYLLRGSFQEGETAAAAALDVVGPDRPVLSARLQAWRGWFAHAQGRNEEAESRLQQAVSDLHPCRAPSAGDRDDERATALGRAHSWLGFVRYTLGDYEQSARDLREALVWLRAAGDRAGQAEALLSLGVTLHQQGQEQGAAHVEQSLALFEQQEDHMGMARALNWLGNLSNGAGDYDRAQTCYERSLALNRDIGHDWPAASSLVNLAVIAKRRAQYERSQELSRESLALFRKLGARRGVASVLNNLGDVARLQAQYEKARALYEESLAIRRDIGEQFGVAVSLQNLGLVANALHEPQAARRVFHEALEIAAALGADYLTLHILSGVAAHLAQQGQHHLIGPLLHLSLKHPAAAAQGREEAARLLQQLQDCPLPPDDAPLPDLQSTVAATIAALKSTQSPQRPNL
ncbi:MAG TPA: tetratricopeptide repeat protein [Candidatus Sulfomarinibacteraceae bacterium]|nr:tetratricopeptide repeat protein [Candidatus Sulfomarinibacteraceae bacterium]